MGVAPWVRRARAADPDRGRAHLARGYRDETAFPWTASRSTRSSAPPTTTSTWSASDKATILIDGTVVDLRSFHGDPGAERIKSDAAG